MATFSCYMSNMEGCVSVFKMFLLDILWIFNNIMRLLLWFVSLTLPITSAATHAIFWFHLRRRSQTTTCRSWWWSRLAGWLWCVRRSPCLRTQRSAVSNTITGLTPPSATPKTPKLSSSRWDFLQGQSFQRALLPSWFQLRPSWPQAACKLCIYRLIK